MSVDLTWSVSSLDCRGELGSAIIYCLEATSNEYYAALLQNADITFSSKVQVPSKYNSISQAPSTVYHAVYTYTVHSSLLTRPLINIRNWSAK